MPEIRDIDVSLIDPSPYQHRQAWNQAKLTELAKSIKRDGLIEPIVVRCLNGTGRYELIAGERRLRACKLVEISAILGRVVEVNDTQARRMCAAENLQREDLSAIEELHAIVEMLDAELIEDETYASFGGKSVDRVKWLLMKMDSDRRTGTDYFSNKFIGRVDIIFSNLPKPKEWLSFYNNDFRNLVNIDADVAAFAAQNKLNKSQTVETQKLKDALPQTFEGLKRSTNEEGEAVTTIINQDFQRVQVDFRDLSAREIAEMSRQQTYGPQVDSAYSENVHFLSETNEWYTPKEIIERVIKVLGQIDLDPCANPGTPTIPALTHYTQANDGLAQPWFGRVYMNPPYGDEIKGWIEHLCSAYKSKLVSEAIALVPSRTDTEWFRLLKEYPRCFIWGRLKFSNSILSAPFPSMVVYLGGDTQLFYQHFRDLGDIYGLVDGFNG